MIEINNLLLSSERLELEKEIERAAGFIKEVQSMKAPPEALIRRKRQVTINNCTQIEVDYEASQNNILQEKQTLRKVSGIGTMLLQIKVVRLEEQLNTSLIQNIQIKADMQKYCSNSLCGKV